jgi:Cupin domain.
MRIFSFDKGTGKEITAYHSQNAFFSKIMKHDKPIHVGCIFVEPDGIVGAHQAPIHQLFVVISGQGWVVGKEGKKVDIAAGQAAYWEPGEMHESGSSLGMAAIVIEGEDLNPSMNEVDWQGE